MGAMSAEPQNRTPPMLDHIVEAPIVWTGETLAPDDGLVMVSDRCLAELEAMAVAIDDNPLPLATLRPDDFDLPACRGMMAGAKEILENGVGFVLLDRLPVADWGAETSKAIYWLLASMVARPVAQKWIGTMIYDVHDSGKEPGNGVRPDITNMGQNYHTDNSYNLCPPHYVSLLCLQTAMEGGVSGLVSFYTAHNEMLRRHPELLGRLYRDYTFDRQREHAPDDEMILRHPMFSYSGERLTARLSHFQVVNGQKMAGEPLDEEGAEALAAFEAILDEPGMSKDFHFEPGQIQIVDNLRCGHRRSAFRDWPEEERKRRLVRLWLRDVGRPFYHG